MERVMRNDYRQQPITSEDVRTGSCQYLARLEDMIAAQEDAVVQARTDGDGNADTLAQAHTRLWRLLTKRQGVVDAIQAYEDQRVATH